MLYSHYVQLCIMLSDRNKVEKKEINVITSFKIQFKRESEREIES